MSIERTPVVATANSVDFPRPDVAFLGDDETEDMDWDEEPGSSRS
jgi:hypothetical protein